MIEINLLPEDFKVKKSAAEAIDLPIIPIIAAVVAGLVVVHAVAFLIAANNRKTITKIQTELENLTPKKNEIMALNLKVKEMENKVKAIEILTLNRIVWAKVLNSISDSMLQRVWLSRVKFERRGVQPVIMIEGYIADKSEAGTAMVAKFINSLKENKEFMTHVKDIELDNVRSSLIAGQEIMRFVLVCQFRT